ncbi:MAG TPA: hypothetical protein VFK10_00615, partial [Burkholderiaceae bacterium]|nr:hypothetical protein [Burkholderiaceae bacterium]
MVGDDLWRVTREHLMLVIVSVLVAVPIGVPLPAPHDSESEVTPLQGRWASVIIWANFPKYDFKPPRHSRPRPGRDSGRRTRAP